MSLLDRLESYPYKVPNRWFLRTVRDYQKLIVAHELTAEGLRLHKVMRRHDLYIGAPPPPIDYCKQLPLHFDGMCQKCGQAMPVGLDAIWQHGIGTWHIPCWHAVQDAKPPNQRTELRL